MRIRINKAILKLTICLVTFTASPVFSQGEAAVPFLMINPSPRLNGMAGAFTSLPSTDPHAMYSNPAQLGNFSREYNFSLAFYPGETKWLPQFNFSDLTFKSTALTFGYNLQNYNPDLPISIGMGFINTKLNLGKNVYTDENGNELGTFDSREYYTAFSLGIGFDYWVKLNLGYTYKKITSELSNITVGSESQDGKGKINAQDIGLQLTIPGISIIEKLQNKDVTVFGNFKPSIDLSFGYSILNIGDKIVYIDARQADPIPRAAQIGIAVSLGLDMDIYDTSIRLFQFDWASDAQDILVRRDTTRSSYISPPGDIDFWKNVIQGTTNNSVVIYRGWRIQIFELCEYSTGNIIEDINYGARDVTTTGYRFTTRGFMKSLSQDSNNDVINYIANHIELSYTHSSYKTPDSGHPLNNTEFNGITISVFGF